MPIEPSASPTKLRSSSAERSRDNIAGNCQTVIEDIHLPNPVIRSHYGNGFIKQYVRDHLLLRTEAATNNVNDYGVKKAVENLPNYANDSPPLTTIT